MNREIRYVNLEQGTEEWKEFRKWKIGSSIAASILGKGFKTPLQLFEDIIEDKETIVNEAMIRGTMMEPKARAWLNEKYKADLQPVVVQHPNPEIDWHISSLDGLWVRPDGSIFVVEIKHPGMVDHQTALDGKVPEKYIPQCYHILEDLPGVSQILYLSFREDSQAEIWVNRNEQEMSIQFEAERSFYKRLINLDPPEPTDKDWVEVKDDDVESLAHEYNFLKYQIFKMENKTEELKNNIISKIGSLSRAKIGDMRVQKVIRNGAIDYSKIEALKGLDLNSYRKAPIVSWRISKGVSI